MWDRKREITVTTQWTFHSINQGRVHPRNKTSEAAKDGGGEKGSVSLASGAAAAAEIQHSQRLFGSAYLQ